MAEHWRHCEVVCVGCLHRSLAFRCLPLPSYHGFFTFVCYRWHGSARLLSSMHSLSFPIVGFYSVGFTASLYERLRPFCSISLLSCLWSKMSKTRDRKILMMVSVSTESNAYNSAALLQHCSTSAMLSNAIPCHSTPAPHQCYTGAPAIVAVLCHRPTH